MTKIVTYIDSSYTHKIGDKVFFMTMGGKEYSGTIAAIEFFSDEEGGSIVMVNVGDGDKKIPYYVDISMLTTDSINPQIIIEYVFPAKSHCPRCKKSDTIAIASLENIQYRECKSCQNNYSIKGKTNYIQRTT